MVGFTLASLGIIIFPSPGDRPDTLEGEQMHSLPERFDARSALPGKSVLAALKEHRRGAR